MTVKRVLGWKFSSGPGRQAGLTYLEKVASPFNLSMARCWANHFLLSLIIFSVIFCSPPLNIIFGRTGDQVTWQLLCHDTKLVAWTQGAQWRPQRWNLVSWSMVGLFSGHARLTWWYPVFFHWKKNWEISRDQCSLHWYQLYLNEGIFWILMSLWVFYFEVMLFFSFFYPQKSWI